MAFDAKKWLIEDMGFTEDEATALAPKLKADKIEASIGLMSANAAAQQQLQKAQADLQAANERLNVEMSEWAKLTSAEKAAATEQQAALEAARVRAAQLETRLTSLATQHGVDPKSVLEGAVVVPEVKKPAADPNAVDPRYATMDAFGAVANYNLDLAGALPYIAQQHFDLTGERLDTRAIVAEVKARSKKNENVDPVAIWEDKYGIPAKRAAKEAEARAAELKAADERGYERARSEISIPGPQAPGRHSIVFGKRNDQGVVTDPRTSALKRPQPGTTAMGAAAALRSGKYRQTAGTGR